MKEFIIGTNEAGQRFDKYLARILPAAQKSFIYKMLRKKNITLNGKKAQGNEILSVSDVIRLYFSDETFDTFARAKKKPVPTPDPAFDLSSAVVYSDDDIMIVNKPAGILSQPDKTGAPNLSDALITYLVREGIRTEEELRMFRPAPVNRLDRNTTGLVLCGMSLRGSQYLSEIIRNEEVKKHYLTVVRGSIEGGVFSAYLGKDPVKNTVTVRADVADGYVKILTGVQVLCRAGDFSLLDIDLITGKKHQIRSHLAFLGVPVIGDMKYGDRDLCRTMKREFGLRYQFLHAVQVTFPKSEGHFSYLSDRTFTAPIPADKERVLAGLGLRIPKTKEDLNLHES